MSAGLDAAGDAARQAFLDLLDRASPQNLTLWWRDDDAETATAELDRLLALARRHDLPLGLAVIPKGADAALAARLAGEKRVLVLQHGWQHRAHNPEGEKKAELGDQRPLADILEELRAGFGKLEGLFGPQFLPVLVPPWNRIGDAVRARREEAGLLGLSTFGPGRSEDRRLVNSHLDIIAWKSGRRALSRTKAYSILIRETQDRLSGNPEPIGILTHHLAHDGEAWSLLGELLGLLGNHPAATWPSLPDLFRLPSRRASQALSL